MESMCPSTHYAIKLANLAKEFRFDGWLVNIEVPLAVGPEKETGIRMTRVLAAWVELFKEEVRRALGDDGEVIWYDSVIYTGHLAWQDRLDSVNLPFFEAAGNIFTNYTWPTHYPYQTLKYLNQCTTLRPQFVTGPPNSIYMGVDMHGRGSHGGGGFGAYKALQHIVELVPQVENGDNEKKEDGEGEKQEGELSVALFAPAWTWEDEEDLRGGGADGWRKWWKREKSLWIGPLPPPPKKEDPPPTEDDPSKAKPKKPPCTHPHPPSSLTSFFTPPRLPTPPFCTNFSPGVGTKWFVKGRCMAKFENGWTDIDKQDLWSREGEVEFDDGWCGGSSLRVDLDLEGWKEVQKVGGLEKGCEYEVNVIWKGEREVEFQIRHEEDTTIPQRWTTKSLENGWRESICEFTSLSSVIVVGLLPSPPPLTSIPSSSSILLAHLSLHPTPSPAGAHIEQTIHTITFFPQTPQLTWRTALILPALPPEVLNTDLETINPEDPLSPYDPLFLQQRHRENILYYDIFVQSLIGPEVEPVWIGSTSGHHGTKLVLPNNFGGILPQAHVRGRMVGSKMNVVFKVQGVTDRGEVVSGAATSPPVEVTL